MLAAKKGRYRLVVTKRLVELMGGTIGVKSTVGLGCEFWIELIRDVTPQLAAETPCPQNVRLKLRKTRRYAPCSMWKIIRPT